MGLCFRCEHRAVWLEGRKIRPRFECANIDHSVGTCYMFLPTRPIAVKKSNKSDDRPITLDILGARVEQAWIEVKLACVICDVALRKRDKDEKLPDEEILLPYWDIRKPRKTKNGALRVKNDQH